MKSFQGFTALLGFILFASPLAADDSNSNSLSDITKANDITNVPIGETIFNRKTAGYSISVSLTWSDAFNTVGQCSTCPYTCDIPDPGIPDRKSSKGVNPFTGGKAVTSKATKSTSSGPTNSEDNEISAPVADSGLGVATPRKRLLIGNTTATTSPPVNSTAPTSTAGNTTATTSPVVNTTSSTSTSLSNSTAVPSKLVCGSSKSGFNPCKFNFGAFYLPNAREYAGLDYLGYWIGSFDERYGNAFNPETNGRMLAAAKKVKATPLYYGYIIAFLGRTFYKLQDCDVGSPNLCEQGAKFIRSNKELIYRHYANYSASTAKIMGKNAKVVWLIEPDYYQYTESRQEGGGLTGQEAKEVFTGIVSNIKKYLPNSLISFDVSPWANEAFAEYWDNFKDIAEIDYISTSGGRQHANTTRIREDPNNLMTWKWVTELTGKKLIADTGYGVGGGSSGFDDSWMDPALLNERIADGLVAITQAVPLPGLGSRIQQQVRKALVAIPGSENATIIDDSSTSNPEPVDPLLPALPSDAGAAARSQSKYFSTPIANGCCQARKNLLLDPKGQPSCDAEAIPPQAEQCGFYYGPTVTYTTPETPPEVNMFAVLFATIDCENFWSVSRVPAVLTNPSLSSADDLVADLAMENSLVVNQGCYGSPQGSPMALVGCILQSNTTKFVSSSAWLSRTWTYKELASRCVAAGGKCGRTNNVFRKNLKCCLNYDTQPLAAEDDWNPNYEGYIKTKSPHAIDLNNGIIIAIVFGSAGLLVLAGALIIHIRKKARDHHELMEARYQHLIGDATAIDEEDGHEGGQREHDELIAGGNPLGARRHSGFLAAYKQKLSSRYGRESATSEAMGEDVITPRDDDEVIQGAGPKSRAYVLHSDNVQGVATAGTPRQGGNRKRNERAATASPVRRPPSVGHRAATRPPANNHSITSVSSRSGYVPTNPTEIDLEVDADKIFTEEVLFVGNGNAL